MKKIHKLLLAIAASIALVFAIPMAANAAPTPKVAQSIDACSAYEFSVTYFGVDLDGHNVWTIKDNGPSDSMKAVTFQFTNNGVWLGKQDWFVQGGSWFQVTSPFADQGSTEYLSVAPTAGRPETADCLSLNGPGAFATILKGKNHNK